MRTNIYVDGFNLYYGAVKNTPYRWLDIERLFAFLRPHDDIQTIYYFTALISGRRSEHQLTYLKALEMSPKVTVVFGKFKLKTVTCGVRACDFGGNRRFRMPEEKRTDVQIALAMVRDAWANACERFILVTGDSDLVPAINTVKEIDPEKRVHVYVPALHPVRGAAVELRSAADKDRILPNQLIRKAQFPAKIPDGSGGFIEKPSDW